MYILAGQPPLKIASKFSVPVTFDTGCIELLIKS